MHIEHFSIHTLEYTTNLTAMQNLKKHHIKRNEKKKETLTLYLFKQILGSFAIMFYLQ